MGKDSIIFQRLNEIPTHDQLEKEPKVLAAFFSPRAQVDKKAGIKCPLEP